MYLFLNPNGFEKTDVRWDFFYFIAPNSFIKQISIIKIMKGGNGIVVLWR